MAAGSTANLVSKVVAKGPRDNLQALQRSRRVPERLLPYTQLEGRGDETMHPLPCYQNLSSIQCGIRGPAVWRKPFVASEYAAADQ